MVVPQAPAELFDELGAERGPVPEREAQMTEGEVIVVPLPSGRLDPAQSFPAYLYKISRNRAFTFLKKNASDEATRLQIMQRISEITESPYHQTLWAQYQQMLNNAITQLPYQRQRVFTLCRQEGKSYDEAAQELGISRNTVKEHMVMALKDIKAYFYRHGDLSLAILLLMHRF